MRIAAKISGAIEAPTATSDIVTDALTAFVLKACDSGHFADIPAVVSSNDSTNVTLIHKRVCLP